MAGSFITALGNLLPANKKSTSILLNVRLVVPGSRDGMNEVRKYGSILPRYCRNGVTEAATRTVGYPIVSAADWFR
jgi:hypothetical protein